MTENRPEWSEIIGSEVVIRSQTEKDESDTVGAVAGGLAGLAYGYGSIPAEWIDVLARKEWINDLCDEFAKIMITGD